MLFSQAFSDLMVLEEGSPEGQPPWGITQSLLDSWAESKGIGHHDVMTLPRSIAIDFVEDEYWIPCGCGSLPDKLDFVVFQACYNLGQWHGICLLQSAVGVTVDGIIGPITLRAAKRAPLVETCKMVLTYQNRYYVQIENQKNMIDEAGWHNRVTRTAKMVGITL